MKKIMLLCMLMACFYFTYAQTKTADSITKAVKQSSEAIGQGGNNEIKLNLLYSVLGLPEISYERLLEDNMGVGLSVLVGLDDETDFNFGVIPHFRIYFGAKKASGFFIEANAAYMSTNEVRYNYYYSGSDFELEMVKKMKYNSFGLGAAAGGKFLTRNGFLGEAYFGLGRLFGNNTVEAYPRIGITIGKRF